MKLRGKNKASVGQQKLDFIQKIDKSLVDLGIDTRKFKFDREDLHRR